MKNISQLGSLFPIYGKIKNVPNHQPANSVFEQQKIHLRVARSVSVASAWIRNDAQTPTCRRQRHQRCEGSDGITTRRHGRRTHFGASGEGLWVARNERFSNLGLLWYSTYIYICICIYIYIYRIIGCVYMIIIHHYIPRTYIIEKTLSPTQVRVPHQAVHSSQPFWSLVSEIDPSEAAVGILQCFPVEIVPGWDRTQLWVKSIRWNLTLWLWKKLKPKSGRIPCRLPGLTEKPNKSHGGFPLHFHQKGLFSGESQAGNGPKLVADSERFKLPVWSVYHTGLGW